MAPRRDRIMQWGRDIPYHYELHAPDGTVLCRVARKGQAERAAAVWPGDTLPQAVRVRGVHLDTLYLVALLLLIPAVAIGTLIMTKLMMGAALLAVLGSITVLLISGDGMDRPAWDTSAGELLLSAEQMAEIREIIDGAVDAEIQRRYPSACPACGAPVTLGPGRAARAAAPDPERECPPPLSP